MTLMCNPLMGHISAMYSLTTGESSFGSRFDFNAYSYVSELSIGCELWRSAQSSTSTSSNLSTDMIESKSISSEGSDSEADVQEPAPVFSTFKASTSLRAKSLNLLWEGRFQEVLVSAGVGLSLASRTPEFSKLGVSLQYSS